MKNKNKEMLPGSKGKDELRDGTAEKPSVVQKYKDTIFRMIYSDKRELLVLYNAVSGGAYTEPEQLEVVTLEQAIYMAMKNDVSFILDTRLSLYEQQSTVCPNMPLRDLMYVAKQFELLTVGKEIYSTRLIRLPAPRFITFYNGKQKQPEQLEQKLSDAYYGREDAGEDVPNLELRVLQLNINPGYNEELKRRCPTLLEYVEYVECVRKYEKSMPLREAVEAAVEECIGNGVLRDFLMREKAKVISMSIFEFDQERYERTIRDESWEDGWNEGRKDGWNEGRKDGWNEGQDAKLISLVCRKLRKGKGVEAIADELEEDVAVIQQICEAAEAYAPNYDEESVIEKLKGVSPVFSN